MTYKVAIIVDGSETSLPTDENDVRTVLEDSGHQVLTLEADSKLTSRLLSDKPQVAYVAANTKSPGSIQSLLELLEIPCIGSDSSAVRRASDSEAVAAAIGAFYAGFDGCASTPAFVALDSELFELADAGALLSAVVEKLPGGYPVVVRAAVENGTVAPLRVDTEEELVKAVEQVLAVCNRVVVQEWLEGVMLSVSVLGGADDPFALPPIELGMSQEGDPQVYAPVRLESLSKDESMSQAIRSEVERAAVESYAALGCRDLGRVDILWDGARAKVLRVDSTPSLNASSLFLLGCQTAQLGSSAVLQELVEQALYRS